MDTTKLKMKEESKSNSMSSSGATSGNYDENKDKVDPLALPNGSRLPRKWKPMVSEKNGGRTTKRNILIEAAKKGRNSKCQRCQYESSWKCHLNRHIQIHTGERPFQCNVCFKTFTQKTSLNRHTNFMHQYFNPVARSVAVAFTSEVKWPTKEKCKSQPYDCPICLESFIRKEALIVRLRFHVNELPFRCLKCGRRFAEEKAKESHEKRCKRRSFECYLCRYKCFNNSDVLRHMQAIVFISTF